MWYPGIIYPAPLGNNDFELRLSYTVFGLEITSI